MNSNLNIQDVQVITEIISLEKSILQLFFQQVIYNRQYLVLDIVRYRANSNQYFGEYDIQYHEEHNSDEVIETLIYYLVESIGTVININTRDYQIQDFCIFDNCQCNGHYNNKDFQQLSRCCQLNQQLQIFISEMLSLFSCFNLTEILSPQYQLTDLVFGCQCICWYNQHVSNQFTVGSLLSFLVQYTVLSQQVKDQQANTLTNILIHELQFSPCETQMLRRSSTVQNVKQTNSNNTQYCNYEEQFIQKFQNLSLEQLQSCSLINLYNISVQQFLHNSHMSLQFDHQLSHLHKSDQYQALVNTMYYKYQQYAHSNIEKYKPDQIVKIIQSFKQQSTIINRIKELSTDSFIFCQEQPEIIDHQFLFCQSDYFNGECSQRQQNYFYNIQQYHIDTTEEILQLFEHLDEMSLIEYQCIVLNSISNRYAKIKISDNALYLLLDTPKNQFFVQGNNNNLQMIMQQISSYYQQAQKSSNISSILFSYCYNNVDVQEIYLNKIVSIIERDFGGLNSAVEIYLCTGKSYSFVFNNHDVLKSFEQQILSRQPEMLRFINSNADDHNTIVKIDSNSRQSPIANRSSMCKYLHQLLSYFAENKLSSFQFLDEINILANRSYNDSSQYPIFPLLFGSLDNCQLKSRILQLPVSLQNKERIQACLEKLNDGAAFGNYDQVISTVHYSHSAICSSYMIRIEPWFSSHLLLQQGNIDQADRLFDSITQYFINATSSTQNCEEMIPEAFYEQEFYYNPNNIDFGKKQNGEQINNVQLPKQFDNPEQYIVFSQALLENNLTKEGIITWLSYIFSDHNTSIDGKDLIQSLHLENLQYINSELKLYPSITEFHVFSSDQVNNSLKYYKELNKEISDLSTITKLINFGRQPKPLFSVRNSLLYSEQQKYLRNTEFAQEFISNFMNRFLLGSINNDSEIFENYEELQIKQQIQIQFLPDYIIEHFQHGFDIIQPGFLHGSRQNFGNINVRASNGINYRSDNLTLQFKPKILSYSGQNQTNSISYKNCYLFSSISQYQYFSNCQGEFVSLYKDYYINIYKLPSFSLFDRIKVNNANYVLPVNSQFEWLQSQNQLLVCRDYGVLDIFSYSTSKKEIESMINVAICDEQLQRCWYNHSWRTAVILCESKLVIMNMAYLQIWFSIKLKAEETVQNCIIFDKIPIIVVVCDNYSRIFNLRTAKEYHSMTFTPTSYYDDQLYGIFDNSVYTMKDFYAQCQKGKYEKEDVGTTNLGSIKAVMVTSETLFISVKTHSNQYLLCTIEK